MDMETIGLMIYGIGYQEPYTMPDQTKSYRIIKQQSRRHKQSDSIRTASQLLIVPEGDTKTQRLIMCVR